MTHEIRIHYRDAADTGVASAPAYLLFTSVSPSNAERPSDVVIPLDEPTKAALKKELCLDGSQFITFMQLVTTND